YRGRLAREGRRPVADGRGHARLRLRRAAELAPLLPDQGRRYARRADGAHPGAAGVSRRIVSRRYSRSLILSSRDTASSGSGFALRVCASIITIVASAVAVHTPS